jgi:hypothetical protein
MSRRTKISAGAITEDTLEDKDGDTIVTVEQNVDEDKIRFGTAGTERMVISDTGNVGIGTDAPSDILTINGAESVSDATMIKFTEAGADRAMIGINTSNNLLIQNDFSNKHIVFKASDAGTIKEGLRLDGAVPEVVVNQNGASGENNTLVDFRVESDNNTHMLYVDGANDRVGINTATPSAALDVVGDVKVSGHITAGGQPAFLARKPLNNQDQFAVGSGVDVTLSTEDFDVGSNFASNTFTAPTTGVYIFTANIYLVDLDTDANYYALDLVTTAGTYRLAAVDPGGFSTDLTQYILGGSIPVSLAAGDTAKIQVYQSGGTQQTNIRGAGTRGTFFAGYLLG